MKLVYKDSVYSINRVNIESIEPLYVIYRESHKGNGYICKGIYQGTKEECKAELKRIKVKKLNKKVSEDYEIGV